MFCPACEEDVPDYYMSILRMPNEKDKSVCFKCAIKEANEWVEKHSQPGETKKALFIKKPEDEKNDPA